MKSRWILLATLTLAVSAPGLAESVSLESRDGKTLKAEVLETEEDSVKVRREDGKEFSIPFSRLKPESVKVVKDLIKKREDAIPPPEIPASPTSPADLPEKAVVMIGEKKGFTLKFANGKIWRPKPLKEGLDDQPCFRVDFSKQEKLVMAKIWHTYPVTMEVRCLARIKGREDYFETRILPLQKGIPSFESWGDDIEELVFFGFTQQE